MDKGLILAITSSTFIFLIILAFIFYSHSDFDQQLIEQVDNGVPAKKLVPQIDQETEKLISKAKSHYGSEVSNNFINKNYEKGNITSRNYYLSYLEEYENEMKMISKYDAARKNFARRKITKEQFIQEIQTPKDYIQLKNY